MSGWGVFIRRYAGVGVGDGIFYIGIGGRGWGE